MTIPHHSMGRHRSSCISLDESVRVSGTKYHKLGGLNSRNYFFFHVLEAGVPGHCIGRLDFS